MDNVKKEKEAVSPAYLFEVSWEVCNKVGGIHTVVSTKALSMMREFNNNHILIGPDIWRYNEPNPEFTEDTHLFSSWRSKVAREGLRVKTGHWNIAGNPIVILVDFTVFIPKKDQILASFWEKFRLDSLTGQWDYIEPVLFGYAAGKVIESFVKFNLTARSSVLAQFHEWMTGSGLLYLRDSLPQAGCVFTTHATVLGRCIAGNGLGLYDQIGNYNPNEAAHRFNVVSKHSLECKAAEYADCFTTVSEITAEECSHFLGKQVDMVTPNGFENGFVPEKDVFEQKRKEARAKMFEVAENVLGRKVSDNALIVATSGRYEFRNKGIDVFIDALSCLDSDSRNEREVLAFIMVPAGIKGVSRNPEENRYSTHELCDPWNDPVLKRLSEKSLVNGEDNRVKVVFVPSYLNGNDGVFNMTYYDLLIGMDLTVFPSYYEPWGYTPLESLAFKVPTITTTLAGFGRWVDTHCAEAHPGISVIERKDSDGDAVAEKIAENIIRIASLDKKSYKAVRENAGRISSIALWKNLVTYYNEAYRIALTKVGDRMESQPVLPAGEWVSIERKNVTSTPNWTGFTVHRSIPESLSALEKLSQNLWWSWNEEAVDLFRSVDPEQWRVSANNPIVMLDGISLNRYRELEADPDFMARLHAVYEKFKEYMKPADFSGKSPSVAYFSMEYGLHSSLKIYSGGLGVLAGDYMKEASDKRVNITGVGLLYRYGYFNQKFSATGAQEADYEAQDFSKIPVTQVRDENGDWLTLSLPFPGRTLYAHVWRVDIGRAQLYLLDTDFEANRDEDRSITHFLYGGDWENRLKQEILLGFGGIQALRKLGIDADVYHCNEGHAAFIGLERLLEYVENEHLSFPEAMEVVRASSLFTTHTPVPAGHDAFDEDMLRGYLSYLPGRMKISWEQLMALGKINATDRGEKFSMSFLAASLSQEVNGVSMLHGEVSRGIFKDMWPGYMPEELHVSYVTNGVHHPTWTAPEWKRVEAEVFGEDFKTHHYDKSCFEGIYRIPDRRIHDIRNLLRKQLIDYIKYRLSNEKIPYFAPRQIVQIEDTLRDDILTIGFARRFATYKRAHLLFSNLDRLAAIVNNPDRPVQFIFAGKAHPADKAGQDLIKRIVEISKYPQFIGKILFLPNYDMDLARHMVQGVDVWMNTPTRPLEASGTSGQKAAMNGVMHFSVLDGWWVEGYRPGAGWALPKERAYENQDYQNELDAEVIYNILEDEIVPAFYSGRSENGHSSEWTAYIKNTIAKVACDYTSNRMMNDYEDKFYVPMARRSAKLKENSYAMAIEISEWKNRVTRSWEDVKVETITLPDKSRHDISMGKSYKAEIKLDTGVLSIDDIGVELVVSQKKDNRVEVVSTHEFQPVSCAEGKAVYSLEVTPSSPGAFLLGIRIFPKNSLLPHRQDFALVKWV